VPCCKIRNAKLFSQRCVTAESRIEYAKRPKETPSLAREGIYGEVLRASSTVPVMSDYRRVPCGLVTVRSSFNNQSI